MKALGMLEINEENKTIYIKKVDDSYVYYLDNKEIGGYSPKVTPDRIIFKQNTKANELSAEIKDKIEQFLENIEIEEIQNIPEDYNKEKVRGLEKLINTKGDGKIQRITEIDLKKEINLDKIGEDKQQKEYKEQKQEVNNKNDINIKQEMNFDNKVTDMKTLGQLIQKEGKMPQMEGKKFTKMGIIESYQMNDIVNEKEKQIENNTTRYSFVAIATDGTIVPMDLEQDYQEGDNPTETIYQTNQDGEVEKDNVLSRFTIGEGTFSIKNGQYGELKVYHSPRKTIGGEGIEGNKSLDVELETDNVWELRKEERDIASEYGTGYRSVEEGYQEVRKNEDGNEKECEELRTEDIDGDKNTQSHNHNEEFVQKTADELLKIEIIDEVFTRNEVEKFIKEKVENNNDLTKEELKHEAEMLNRERNR